MEVYGSYLETGPKNISDKLTDYGIRTYSGGITELIFQQISSIDPALVDALNDDLPNRHFPQAINATKEWPRFYTILKKRYPAGADASLPGGQNAGPESFTYLGKPAIFWARQRNGADVLQRTEAVAALGFIAQKHMEFIPFLVVSLRDPSYEVVQTASLALSDLGPPSNAVAICRPG